MKTLILKLKAFAVRAKRFIEDLGMGEGNAMRT